MQRVLELRLGGAQAAVKKLDALLVRAGDDDRVRNNYRFNGASTGRFSGEGAQVQNLKRPIVEDIDAAIAAIATGDYAHVKSLYEKPLAVVGDCSRSMITAGENNKFIGGDFSSIEARTLAWIAGEEQALNPITSSMRRMIPPMSPIASLLQRSSISRLMPLPKNSAVLAKFAL